METLERLLGRIDRRLVYLGLVIFTLVPLVEQWNLPTPSSQNQADRLGATIEAI